RVETEASIGLEGWVLVPDPVDDRDQLAEAIRPVALPRAQLVLLRIKVFLRALLSSAALHQLEGRTVDAVAGAERGGQDQSRLERRPASGLEVLAENVGRVGPEVGPEELPDRRLRELWEVLIQLPGRVAPREVRVRLAESDLGEPVHDPGARERFRQQDRVGMQPFELA